MAEVLLFHHVQGLTEGVRDLAEQVRAAGHTVHVPDLFDGATADSVEDGIALVGRLGDEALDARVDQLAAELPPGLVYAGISWGAAAAQRLAQTRPGARGALLYESCLPISGDWAIGPWPETVPVQIHGMEQDPIFGLEGDLDSARALVASVGPDVAELFVYPGDRHLFTDRSLPSYDAEATAAVVRRSLELLDRVDQRNHVGA